MSERAAAPVAFVLKGYPRLSETFIAQEIHALEKRGLDVVIVSLRQPTDRQTHPVHRDIKATVIYLPEYLRNEPGRVFRAWRRCRRLAGYRRARRLWLADLRRDPTPNRVRRFGQALVLASEIGDALGGLHAHFIHTPASVARYAAHLTGKPFTLSAHAKDIWTIPNWEKREKLTDAAWAVTCTRANRDHLTALAPEARIDLVYHGIDLSRFPAPDPSDRARGDKFVILSVGRAVAKKGFDVLLEALALLPASLDWRFEHIGDGPLIGALRRQADSLGIADRVVWHGPRPQEAVLTAMRRADLFVLASRVADDGDRDGLPNVLLEAQSQAVCCLASDVAAIAELIDDGATGRLVPPNDAAALAGSIVELASDPVRRDRLAAAGQRRVRTQFDLEACVHPLVRLFRLDDQLPFVKKRA